MKSEPVVGKKMSTSYFSCYLDVYISDFFYAIPKKAKILGILTVSSFNQF